VEAEAAFTDTVEVEAEAAFTDTVEVEAVSSCAVVEQAISAVAESTCGAAAPTRDLAA